ncbi:MAG: FtsX-like permease family protein [Acholeplasmatales bacterium]|jgi:ABC-type antimicrobial peptide transport system permease subunit|nr:FtsX-like permease family protein [Acholeplasmatales bacterium]
MAKITVYRKIVSRQFTKQINKFLSIFLIIFISLIFIIGLSSTPDNLYDTMNLKYSEVINKPLSSLKADDTATISTNLSASLVKEEDIASYLEIQKDLWFDSVAASNAANQYILENIGFHPEWYGNLENVALEYINSTFDNYVNVNARDLVASSYVESVITPSVKYFVTFKQIVNSIGIIAAVLPFVFLAIITIMTMSNVYKKIDNDRLSIGTMKSLGHTNNEIRNQYVTFTSVPAFLGILFGSIIGFRVFPLLIYYAIKPTFMHPYEIPALTYGWFYTISVIISVFIILVVILSTIFFTNQTLKVLPCDLLRAKPPASSKKIVLERIPVIWNKLSFKYKSMFKNIFRHAKNSLVMIFGIAASTLLIFLGTGLLYSVIKSDLAAQKSAVEALVSIVIIVLVFAAAIGVIIIYSSISIVVEERNKEIATLKVLGYSKKEVIGYIYREQALLASVGIIIGIVGGQLLLGGLIELFRHQDILLNNTVYFQNYLFTLAGSIVIIVVTGLLMTFRINKVDMLSSLKYIE